MILKDQLIKPVDDCLTTFGRFLEQETFSFFDMSSWISAVQESSASAKEWTSHRLKISNKIA
jgi:hypothetical protein